MYNSLPSNKLPATGIASSALAYTGLSEMMSWVWVGVGLMVIGGVLVLLSKLKKNRIAFEPVQIKPNVYRFRLTKNGQPIRRKKK